MPAANDGSSPRAALPRAAGGVGSRDVTAGTGVARIRNDYGASRNDWRRNMGLVHDVLHYKTQDKVRVPLGMGRRVDVAGSPHTHALRRPAPTPHDEHIPRWMRGGDVAPPSPHARTSLALPGRTSRPHDVTTRPLRSDTGGEPPANLLNLRSISPVRPASARRARQFHADPQGHRPETPHASSTHASTEPHPSVEQRLTATPSDSREKRVQHSTDASGSEVGPDTASPAVAASWPRSVIDDTTRPPAPPPTDNFNRNTVESPGVSFWNEQERETNASTVLGAPSPPPTSPALGDAQARREFPGPQSSTAGNDGPQAAAVWVRQQSSGPHRGRRTPQQAVMGAGLRSEGFDVTTEFARGDIRGARGVGRDAGLRKSCANVDAGVGGARSPPRSPLADVASGSSVHSHVVGGRGGMRVGGDTSMLLPQGTGSTPDICRVSSVQTARDSLAGAASTSLRQRTADSLGVPPLAQRTRSQLSSARPASVVHTRSSLGSVELDAPARYTVRAGPHDSALRVGVEEDPDTGVWLAEVDADSALGRAGVPRGLLTAVNDRPVGPGDYTAARNELAALQDSGASFSVSVRPARQPEADGGHVSQAGASDTGSLPAVSTAAVTYVIHKDAAGCGARLVRDALRGVAIAAVDPAGAFHDAGVPCGTITAVNGRAAPPGDCEWVLQAIDNEAQFAIAVVPTAATQVETTTGSQVSDMGRVLSHATAASAAEPAVRKASSHTRGSHSPQAEPREPSASSVASSSVASAARIERVPSERLHKELFAAPLADPVSLYVRPLPVDDGLGTVLAESSPAGVWLARVNPGGALHRAGAVRGLICALDGEDVTKASFHSVVSQLAARKQAGEAFDLVLRPVLADVLEKVPTAGRQPRDVERQQSGHARGAVSAAKAASASSAPAGDMGAVPEDASRRSSSRKGLVPSTPVARTLTARTLSTVGSTADLASRAVSSRAGLSTPVAVPSTQQQQQQQQVARASQAGDRSVSDMLDEMFSMPTQSSAVSRVTSGALAAVVTPGAAALDDNVVVAPPHDVSTPALHGDFAIEAVDAASSTPRAAAGDGPTDGGGQGEGEGAGGNEGTITAGTDGFSERQPPPQAPAVQIIVSDMAPTATERTLEARDKDVRTPSLDLVAESSTEDEGTGDKDGGESLEAAAPITPAEAGQENEDAGPTEQKVVDDDPPQQVPEEPTETVAPTLPPVSTGVASAATAVKLRPPAVDRREHPSSSFLGDDLPHHVAKHTMSEDDAASAPRDGSPDPNAGRSGDVSEPTQPRSPTSPTTHAFCLPLSRHAATYPVAKAHADEPLGGALAHHPESGVWVVAVDDTGPLRRGGVPRGLVVSLNDRPVPAGDSEALTTRLEAFAQVGVLNFSVGVRAVVPDLPENERRYEEVFHWPLSDTPVTYTLRKTREEDELLAAVSAHPTKGAWLLDIIPGGLFHAHGVPRGMVCALNGVDVDASDPECIVPQLTALQDAATAEFTITVRPVLQDLEAEERARQGVLQWPLSTRVRTYELPAGTPHEELRGALCNHATKGPYVVDVTHNTVFQDAKVPRGQLTAVNGVATGRRGCDDVVGDISGGVGDGEEAAPIVLSVRAVLQDLSADERAEEAAALLAGDGLADGGGEDYEEVLDWSLADAPVTYAVRKTHPDEEFLAAMTEWPGQGVWVLKALPGGVFHRCALPRGVITAVNGREAAPDDTAWVIPALSALQDEADPQLELTIRPVNRDRRRQSLQRQRLGAKGASPSATPVGPTASDGIFTKELSALRPRAYVVSKEGPADQFLATFEDRSGCGLYISDVEDAGVFGQAGVPRGRITSLDYRDVGTDNCGWALHELDFFRDSATATFTICVLPLKEDEATLDTRVIKEPARAVGVDDIATNSSAGGAMKAGTSAAPGASVGQRNLRRQASLDPPSQQPAVADVSAVVCVGDGGSMTSGAEGSAHDDVNDGDGAAEPDTAVFDLPIMQSPLTYPVRKLDSSEQLRVDVAEDPLGGLWIVRTSPNGAFHRQGVPRGLLTSVNGRDIGGGDLPWVMDQLAALQNDASPETTVEVRAVRRDLMSEWDRRAADADADAGGEPEDARRSFEIATAVTAEDESSLRVPKMERNRDRSNTGISTIEDVEDGEELLKIFAAPVSEEPGTFILQRAEPDEKLGCTVAEDPESGVWIVGITPGGIFDRLRIPRGQLHRVSGGVVRVGDLEKVMSWLFDFQDRDGVDHTLPISIRGALADIEANMHKYEEDEKVAHVMASELSGVTSTYKIEKREGESKLGATVEKDPSTGVWLVEVKPGGVLHNRRVPRGLLTAVNGKPVAYGEYSRVMEELLGFQSDDVGCITITVDPIREDLAAGTREMVDVVGSPLHAPATMFFIERTRDDDGTLRPLGATLADHSSGVWIVDVRPGGEFARCKVPRGLMTQLNGQPVRVGDHDWVRKEFKRFTDEDVTEFSMAVQGVRQDAPPPDMESLRRGNATPDFDDVGVYSTDQEVFRHPLSNVPVTCSLQVTHPSDDFAVILKHPETGDLWITDTANSAMCQAARVPRGVLLSVNGRPTPAGAGPAWIRSEIAASQSGGSAPTITLTVTPITADVDLDKKLRIRSASAVTVTDIGPLDSVSQVGVHRGEPAPAGATSPHDKVDSANPPADDEEKAKTYQSFGIGSVAATVPPEGAKVVQDSVDVTSVPSTSALGVGATASMCSNITSAPVMNVAVTSLLRGLRAWHDGDQDASKGVVVVDGNASPWIVDGGACGAQRGTLVSVNSVDVAAAEEARRLLGGNGTVGSITVYPTLLDVGANFLPPPTEADADALLKKTPVAFEVQPDAATPIGCALASAGRGGAWIADTVDGGSFATAGVRHGLIVNLAGTDTTGASVAAVARQLVQLCYENTPFSVGVALHALPDEAPQADAGVTIPAAGAPPAGPSSVQPAAETTPLDKRPRTKSVARRFSAEQDTDDVAQYAAVLALPLAETTVTCRVNKEEAVDRLGAVVIADVDAGLWITEIIPNQAFARAGIPRGVVVAIDDAPVGEQDFEQVRAELLALQAGPMGEGMSITMRPVAADVEGLRRKPSAGTTLRRSSVATSDAMRRVPSHVTSVAIRSEENVAATRQSTHLDTGSVEACHPEDPRFSSPLAEEVETHHVRASSSNSKYGARVVTDPQAGLWLVDVNPDDDLHKAGVPEGLITAVNGKPVDAADLEGVVEKMASAREIGTGVDITVKPFEAVWQHSRVPEGGLSADNVTYHIDVPAGNKQMGVLFGGDEQGVWVTQVLPHLPFEEAGVVRGLVTAIGGTAPADVEAAQAVLAEAQRNAPTVLEVTLRPVVVGASAEPYTEVFTAAKADQPTTYRVVKEAEDDALGAVMGIVDDKLWLTDIKVGEACFKAGIPRGLIVDVNGVTGCQEQIEELRVKTVLDVCLYPLVQDVEHAAVRQRTLIDCSGDEDTVRYTPVFLMQLADGAVDRVARRTSTDDEYGMVLGCDPLAGLWIVDVFPGQACHKACVPRGVLTAVDGQDVGPDDFNAVRDLVAKRQGETPSSLTLRVVPVIDDVGMATRQTSAATFRRDTPVSTAPGSHVGASRTRASTPDGCSVPSVNDPEARQRQTLCIDVEDAAEPDAEDIGYGEVFTSPLVDEETTYVIVKREANRDRPFGMMLGCDESTGIWVVDVPQDGVCAQAGVPVGLLTWVNGKAVGAGDFDSVWSEFRELQEAGEGRLSVRVKAISEMAETEPEDEAILAMQLSDTSIRYTIENTDPDEGFRARICEHDSGVLVVGVGEGGAFHRAGVPRGLVTAVNDCSTSDRHLSWAVEELVALQKQKGTFSLTVRPVLGDLDVSEEAAAAEQLQNHEVLSMPLADAPHEYKVTREGKTEDFNSVLWEHPENGVYILECVEDGVFHKSQIPRGLVVAVAGRVIEGGDHSWVIPKLNYLQEATMEDFTIAIRPVVCDAPEAADRSLGVTEEHEIFSLPLGDTEVARRVDVGSNDIGLAAIVSSHATKGAYVVEVGEGGALDAAKVPRGRIVAVDGRSAAGEDFEWVLPELSGLQAEDRSFEITVVPVAGDVVADVDAASAEQQPAPLEERAAAAAEEEVAFDHEVFHLPLEEKPTLYTIKRTQPDQEFCAAVYEHAERGLCILEVDPAGSFHASGVPRGVITELDNRPAPPTDFEWALPHLASLQDVDAPFSMAVQAVIEPPQVEVSDVTAIAAAAAAAEATNAAQEAPPADEMDDEDDPAADHPVFAMPLDSVPRTFSFSSPEHLEQDFVAWVAEHPEKGVYILEVGEGGAFGAAGIPRGQLTAVSGIPTPPGRCSWALEELAALQSKGNCPFSITVLPIAEDGAGARQRRESLPKTPPASPPLQGTTSTTTVHDAAAAANSKAAHGLQGAPTHDLQTVQSEEVLTVSDMPPARDPSPSDGQTTGEPRKREHAPGEDDTLSGIELVDSLRMERDDSTAIAADKSPPQQAASDAAPPQPPPVQTVLLTALGARGLPATDANGSSDPYAVVCIDGFPRQQTPHVSRSLNPRWDHKFVYDVGALVASTPDATIECRIDVYDKDLLTRDDYVGGGTVRLTPELLWRGMATAVDVTLPLMARGEPAGVMDVRVGASGQPVPAYDEGVVRQRDAPAARAGEGGLPVVVEERTALAEGRSPQGSAWPPEGYPQPPTSFHGSGDIAVVPPTSPSPTTATADDLAPPAQQQQPAGSAGTVHGDIGSGSDIYGHTITAVQSDSHAITAPPVLSQGTLASHTLSQTDLDASGEQAMSLTRDVSGVPRVESAQISEATTAKITSVPSLHAKQTTLTVKRDDSSTAAPAHRPADLIASSAMLVVPPVSNPAAQTSIVATSPAALSDAPTRVPLVASLTSLGVCQVDSRMGSVSTAADANSVTPSPAARDDQDTGLPAPVASGSHMRSPASSVSARSLRHQHEPRRRKLANRSPNARGDDDARQRSPPVVLLVTSPEPSANGSGLIVPPRISRDTGLSDIAPTEAATEQDIEVPAEMNELQSELAQLRRRRSVQQRGDSQMDGLHASDTWQQLADRSRQSQRYTDSLRRSVRSEDPFALSCTTVPSHQALVHPGTPSSGVSPLSHASVPQDESFMIGDNDLAIASARTASADIRLRPWNSALTHPVDGGSSQVVAQAAPERGDAGAGKILDVLSMPTSAEAVTYKVAKADTTQKFKVRAVDDGRHGVWLAEVTPGGAFEAAGVPRGVVAALNGKDVERGDSSWVVPELLRLDTSGEELTVAVRPVVADVPPPAGVSTVYRVKSSSPEDVFGAVLGEDDACHVWLLEVKPHGTFHNAGVPCGKVTDIDGVAVGAGGYDDALSSLLQLQGTSSADFTIAVCSPPDDATSTATPKHVGCMSPDQNKSRASSKISVASDAAGCLVLEDTKRSLSHLSSASKATDSRTSQPLPITVLRSDSSTIRARGPGATVVSRSMSKMSSTSDLQQQPKSTVDSPPLPDTTGDASGTQASPLMPLEVLRVDSVPSLRSASMMSMPSEAAGSRLPMSVGQDNHSRVSGADGTARAPPAIDVARAGSGSRVSAVSESARSRPGALGKLRQESERSLRSAPSSVVSTRRTSRVQPQLDSEAGSRQRQGAVASGSLTRGASAASAACEPDNDPAVFRATCADRPEIYFVENITAADRPGVAVGVDPECASGAIWITNLAPGDKFARCSVPCGIVTAVNGAEAPADVEALMNVFRGFFERREDFSVSLKPVLTAQEMEDMALYAERQRAAAERKAVEKAEAPTDPYGGVFGQELAEAAGGRVFRVGGFDPADEFGVLLGSDPDTGLWILDVYADDVFARCGVPRGVVLDISGTPMRGGEEDFDTARRQLAVLRQRGTSFRITVKPLAEDAHDALRGSIIASGSVGGIDSPAQPSTPSKPTAPRVRARTRTSTLARPTAAAQPKSPDQSYDDVCGLPVGDEEREYTVQTTKGNDQLGIVLGSTPAGLWILNVLPNDAFALAGVPRGVLTKVNGDPRGEADFDRVRSTFAVLRHSREKFRVTVRPVLADVPPPSAARGGGNAEEAPRQNASGSGTPRQRQATAVDTAAEDDPQGYADVFNAPLQPAGTTYPVQVTSRDTDLGVILGSDRATGLWILEVAPGKACAAAGVPPGLLVAVDGEPVGAADFDKVRDNLSRCRETQTNFTVTVKARQGSGRRQLSLMSRSEISAPELPMPTTEYSSVFDNPVCAPPQTFHIARRPPQEAYGIVLGCEENRGVFLLEVAEGSAFSVAGVPCGVVKSVDGRMITADKFDDLREQLMKLQRNGDDFCITVQPVDIRAPGGAPGATPASQPSVSVSSLRMDNDAEQRYDYVFRLPTAGNVQTFTVTRAAGEEFGMVLGNHPISGVWLVDVFPDDAFHRAGVPRGQLVTVNGTPVAGMAFDDVSALLWNLQSSSPADVAIALRPVLRDVGNGRANFCQPVRSGSEIASGGVPAVPSISSLPSTPGGGRRAVLIDTFRSQDRDRLQAVFGYEVSDVESTYRIRTAPDEQFGMILGCGPGGQVWLVDVFAGDAFDKAGVPRGILTRINGRPTAVGGFGRVRSELHALQLAGVGELSISMRPVLRDLIVRPRPRVMIQDPKGGVVRARPHTVDTFASSDRDRYEAIFALPLCDDPVTYKVAKESPHEEFGMVLGSHPDTGVWLVDVFDGDAFSRAGVKRGLLVAVNDKATTADDFEAVRTELLDLQKTATGVVCISVRPLVRDAEEPALQLPVRARRQRSSRIDNRPPSERDRYEEVFAMQLCEAQGSFRVRTDPGEEFGVVLGADEAGRVWLVDVLDGDAFQRAGVPRGLLTSFNGRAAAEFDGDFDRLRSELWALQQAGVAELSVCVRPVADGTDGAAQSLVHDASGKTRVDTCTPEERTKYTQVFDLPVAESASAYRVRKLTAQENFGMVLGSDTDDRVWLVDVLPGEAFARAGVPRGLLVGVGGKAVGAGDFDRVRQQLWEAQQQTRGVLEVEVRGVELQQRVGSSSRLKAPKKARRRTVVDSTRAEDRERYELVFELPTAAEATHAVTKREGEEFGMVLGAHDDTGVWLVDVFPGCAFARAGVPRGILTAINGEPVSGTGFEATRDKLLLLQAEPSVEVAISVKPVLPDIMPPE